MGCVHNCPTGAAIRLDPAQLFAPTGAITAGSRVQKARAGGGAAEADHSDAYVMETARPQRAIRISPTLALVAVAALVVIVVHTATAGLAGTLGSYRTGLLTLAMFAAAALYRVRKRSLRSSLRIQRTSQFLPAPIRRWMVTMDGLRVWRRFHLAIGVLAALPLWWHMESGRMNTIESLLAAAVVLLLLSGLLGVVIQDLLPHHSRRTGDSLVRIRDVEAAINALFVEAEEKILGRSENLIQTYIRLVRPILQRPQSGLRMFRAMLTHFDAATDALAPARAEISTVGDEAPTFRELLEIAEKKVRLDLNEFDLWFSTAWLRVHIGLSLLVGLLLIIHVLTVVYFVGA
jgi:hypothetical protein